MPQATRTVISEDGTSIAYESRGEGPALILVDGALCYRASGPSQPLAAALAPHFTVFTYDRRGRGESGNTLPYAVDREIEDIDALIHAAGGSAMVYGISSGAALALEAASRGLAIPKLALYEAPFMQDASRPPLPDDFLPRLNAAIDAGRPGDAVKLFLRLVGLPPFFVALMRLLPAWKKLSSVGHTVPYDITIVKDNQQGKPLTFDRWTCATMPTLVAAGSKSDAWMRNAMQALAAGLPRATFHMLPGQTHMVTAKALAPVLREFFSSSERSLWQINSAAGAGQNHPAR